MSECVFTRWWNRHNLARFVRRRLAGRAALVGIDVGLDVVEVVATLPAAPREPAPVVVAFLDLAAEPVGCLVGVRR